METPDDAYVTVWGSGRQSRDFVYIEDCVDLICNYSQAINDGSAINISTAIGTNFNQLAGKVLNLLGKNNQIVNSSDKPEGVFYRVGATDRQHELGFTNRTMLDDGIAKTIEYFKNKS